METVHELKTIQPFFDEIINGRKTFEFRLNDRDFKAGDTVVLKEFNQEFNTYSGREVEGVITYVLEGFGTIPEHYCIFSFKIDLFKFFVNFVKPELKSCQNGIGKSEIDS